MKTVGVGVIGLGIGAVHASHLAEIPGARLEAVADAREDRRQLVATRHGVPTYRDWSEMLEAEHRLDAVVLATPPTIRREPIAAVCERGLALYCEKPPANDIAEAVELTAMVEGSRILNTVGFQYRWSPLAEAMRSMLDGQRRSFARLLMAWPVFSWIRDGGAPREMLSHEQTGGPIMSQGIHMQDALRYVTGDDPVEVAMFSRPPDGSAPPDTDSEETLVVMARHRSGMLSTHVHDWLHSGTLAEVQIVGPDVDLTWHLEGESRLVGRVGGTAVLETTDVDPRRRAMEGFVAAVAAGRQDLLRSPFSDAFKSLAVCVAANEASRTSTSVCVP